ncbi:MAG: SDR family NAD(P)-dependent oxidoreductase [Chitinophagaceae bacterium]|nr:SDR family NAD(P)-dependent oxidoreductase [Chitinophagaceae bacterium]
MPVVFISGATSGFGKACAQRFAAAGYQLILNGRRTDRLNQLASTLKTDFGVESLLLPFDVRNKAEVWQHISALPESWKKIDVLINNAGLALGRDYFDEADMEDWETMIDTNIKGFLYVARFVSHLMVQQGKGHIINMGSTAGNEVYEKGNVYCATKFAVRALSQAMRIDLLRKGIKVTCIQPGAAETEFSLVRFKGDKEKAAQVYEGIKALTAEDVAEVVYFCTTLPEHVCINELTLTCLQQANSFYFHRH